MTVLTITTDQAHVRGYLVLACILQVLWASGPASAQTVNHHERSDPRWLNDASLAVVNAAVGGVVAGVRRRLGGGPFWPAVRQGAVGGVVTYAGKRLGSAPFAGHRWVARQASALGVAISDNAADGLAALDRVYFPVGPVAIEVDRRNGRFDWSGSVNVRDVAAIAYGLWHPDLSFSWSESLSNAYPVFEASNGFLLKDGADGSAAGGVVVIEAGSEALRQRIFDHELVHVIQHDTFNRLIGNPMERWVLTALPGGLRPPGPVRLGVVQWGWYWAIGPLGIRRAYQRPLELEAQWVEYH